MANSILENDQVIWHCSNCFLDAVHEGLTEIIKNKNISQDAPVFKFVERLDQDTYGRGCICVDIANYLKDKKDRHIFAQLLKEAIDHLKIKYEWTDEFYNHALQFYSYLTKQNS